MPRMGMPPDRAIALETLDFFADLRMQTLDLVEAVRVAVSDRIGRLVDLLPFPPIVLLAAIAEALGPVRPHSTKDYNPYATLSEEEYARRYELGRRRYLQELEAQRLRRKAWCKENGPWFLLALVGALLIALLGVAQPPQFVVVASLGLYTGLAWLVCWFVRAFN